MIEIPSSDNEKETARADWLTTGEPGQASNPTKSAPPPSSVAPDESYDVMGGGEEDETDSASVVPPIPPPIPRPVKRPRPAQEPEGEPVEARSRRARRKRGTVEEVWSRWAESGSDIIRLIVVALLLLIPLYYALASLQFALAFLIVIVGALILGLLSYPLFITMERPVRITPEQAIKDYYAALSHPAPHFRRMWLLLSSAGRSSPHYSSYGEFKAYWTKKLEMMKGGVGGRFNPFNFTIRDYKSEKSAGLTELDAKFTLNIRRRAEEASPGQNVSTEIGLVKGPDKMWYLDDGMLPEA